MISAENQPSAIETERAVLAAIMLDERHLDTVAEVLSENDFFSEKHRILFRAMVAQKKDQAPIDERTLQARLQIQGELEAAGGPSYIGAMAVDLPDISAALAYAEIVKDRSTRRSIIAAGVDMIQSAQAGNHDAQEIIALAEAGILALGQSTMQRSLQSFGAGISGTLERISSRKSTALLGLSSGFPDIDALLCGLIPGHLIIVGGRPGMGKTIICTQWAQHVAFRLRQYAAIFSLEMSTEELHLRTLASEAKVNLNRLMTGQLSAGQWKRVMDAVSDQAAQYLWIDDSPDPSPLEIASKCRRLKKEKGLSLIVLDYLQLMKMPGRFENRNLEVAAISRFFKKLAKELMVPVVVISQLNRQVENQGKNDHRPQMSHLRDSGAPEQDADTVAFVYRDEVYFEDDPENKGLAEFIVRKGRSSGTGTANLAFRGEEVRFESLSQQEPPGGFRDRQIDILPFDIPGST